jgi:hypothetical protein
MKNGVIVVTGFILLVVLIPAVGQKPDNEVSKTVRANNIITSFSQFNQNLPVGQILTGMSTPSDSEIVGDTYWDGHWGKSSLLLYKNDQLIEGYITRYDIYKDEFDFKLQDDIRVLNGSKVKNIVWIDSVTNKTRFLVNAREYTEDNVPMVGFLEILVDEEVALFKRIRIEVLKPDFSPALNVGSKDVRILKKEVFYYNNGNQLIRIKSKKSLETLFAGKSRQMDAFIKNEGIKFNNEADLIKLFTSLQANLKM